MLTFLPAHEPERGEAMRAIAAALVAQVDEGRARVVLLSLIDGQPAGSSPLAKALFDAGFVATSHGLLKRAAPKAGGDVFLGRRAGAGFDDGYRARSTPRAGGGWRWGAPAGKEGDGAGKGSAEAPGLEGLDEELTDLGDDDFEEEIDG